MILEEKKRDSLVSSLAAALLIAVATGVGQLIVEEIKEWRAKKKKKVEVKPIKKK